MGLLNNFKLGRKNEHEVNLRSVEIRAGIRRMQATWTPELVQNIEMYHNINAEEELTRLLSEEMSRMIDDEIIQSLRGIADAIVPVELMDEPTGRLFYFDYRYNINDFKFGR